MIRTDPYEDKYGNPDWCHDAQPDGRKALSSLLADFRANPDSYLSAAGFQDKETQRRCHIDDAMENGYPLAATLHDHADHTNLHVHWWLYGKEFVCEYKITTRYPPAGEGEKPEPELAFTLLNSGIYNSEGASQDAAMDYLKLRLTPCPCSNERVDMWWSLTGRVDQTMWHLALMPESNTWMQL